MQKRTAVFLAEGFEEIEALTVVDYLRRAELEVDMISITGQLLVKGSHHIQVKADLLFKDLNPEIYELLVLPGGLPGAEYLRDHQALIKLLQDHHQKNKLIGAICAAPIVLEKAGLTKGHIGTSYPGFQDQLAYREYLEEIVVVDDHLITSRGPASAVYFALKLIELLSGKEKADQIAQDLLIPFIEEKIGKR